MKKHGERAHSKFSASGSERWLNCPGSVALSEPLPDQQNQWTLEGTQAHEVLEQIMKQAMEFSKNWNARGEIDLPGHLARVPNEMVNHGRNAAQFILDLGESLKAEVLVENRVYLKFIHPEMFGTYDGAVLDHFGTLHVFDYKYGAGHSVSPKENLQMIFYGIGVAQEYHWNFKSIRLWIIQPRIKGYDGPVFWETSIGELRKYVDVFKAGVEKVLSEPTTYFEGSWCHWCRAKGICPLKQESKLEKAKSIFGASPLKGYWQRRK